MNLKTTNPESDAANETPINRVIGAAIRVHTELGPGFLESLYEEAFAVKLRLLGIQFERQKPVPVFYRARATCLTIKRVGREFHSRQIEEEFSL